VAGGFRHFEKSGEATELEASSHLSFIAVDVAAVVAHFHCRKYQRLLDYWQLVIGLVVALDGMTGP